MVNYLFSTKVIIIVSNTNIIIYTLG